MPLDDILGAGADYEIQNLLFGKTKNDESTARIYISHPDQTAMNDLLVRLQNHGVNPVETSDAELVPAPMDGCSRGFHSSTNFETFVRLDGQWISVQNPEMDCGLVLRDGGVTTVPMSDVEAGEPVVIGFLGEGGRSAAAPAGLRVHLRVHELGGVQRAAGAAGPPDRRPDA